MKLGFPVQENNGNESIIYGDFCDAPGYLIFDTDSTQLDYIENSCPTSAHEECNAIESIRVEKIDAIILSGIFPEALKNLSDSGIQVISAGVGNVGENIELFKSGSLICLTANVTCGDKNINCMCDCVTD
ncbi:MAG: diguanylate cyclase [Denitrovibrio sp.]|nr:MAG: diguanylate cyclase [Denitrovibrio sp.]